MKTNRKNMNRYQLEEKMRLAFEYREPTLSELVDIAERYLTENLKIEREKHGDKPYWAFEKANLIRQINCLNNNLSQITSEYKIEIMRLKREVSIARNLVGLSEYAGLKDTILSQAVEIERLKNIIK